MTDPSPLVVPAPDPAPRVNPARTAEYRERRQRDLASLESLLSERQGGPAEFVLEVGCGHGHFLTAFARESRSKSFVGIDISKDRIVRARRKARRLQLDNVEFLLADAADFLATLPERFSFSEVFVLFPDPWPKRRHHKNRLIQPAFLHEVARRMRPGARFFFRTDHTEYFEQARAVFRNDDAWQECPDPWPFEESTVFQARAERIHSFVVRRTDFVR